MSRCQGRLIFVAILLNLAAVSARGVAAEKALDFSKAVIVVDKEQPRQVKTAEFLKAEVERRSDAKLAISKTAPAAGAPVIELSTAANGKAAGDAPPTPATAEGYAIWVGSETPPHVYLQGRDDRGLLFAAGKLIQLLRFDDKGVTLSSATRLTAAPKYPVRAHQLGYRNTANTYDRWNVATFEQYIRDLAIFGTNGIELIPPMKEGEKDSPVMGENMWDMNVALCDVIGSHGLSVWMWSSADEDLSKPEQYQEALEKRRKLFRACKYLDEFFVPGGDDGDNLAQYLMPWLKDLAAVLAESHPEAKIWVSNQTFVKEENDYFFNLLATEKPAWLKGVAYGPWTEMPMSEMRERTPEQFELRRYPDINHLNRCQYPVYDWDPAFAHTLNREAVCPRPYAMAHIFKLYQKYASGFGTYSDGTHDDLNKFVWSALGWDPEQPVEEIVRTYAKVFFGDAHADAGAAALIALEKNWEGPILENTAISVTLDQWKALWNARDAAKDPNWRLQMYVLRAYYDAYVQERVKKERAQEAEAIAALASAPTAGADAAISAARAALADTTLPAKSAEYRKEIETLAEQLWKSIGYQLSIKPPYLARNAERGALLDTLDQPLNNRLWLEDQFNAVLAMKDQKEQLARVHALAQWETPGEGSFYDDLGNLMKQPHLVRQLPWEEDPSGVHTSMVEFQMAMDSATLAYKRDRLSWMDQAQTLYGEPLKMRYDGLDPKAKYRLRVTYSGRFNASMTLTAEEKYKIHDALSQSNPPAPVEFEIPAAAISDGVLELSWDLVKGRGCQVGEVWLLKVDS